MRRQLLAAGAAAAVVAVTVVAALGLGGGNDEPSAQRRAGPAATTTVTRTTLVRTVVLPGEVSFGATTPLASSAAGTVTWLPPVGSTVERGGPVLRVDETPVVLLYGPLPMYRALAEGVTGPDVRQFERNLADLGYPGVTVDERFTASTATAVKRWQKALKLPETGVVDRERVVYAAGAIRVAGHTARIGGSAAGDVLTYTGNQRVVTVAAEPARLTWASADVAVVVALPDGARVAGRVTGVSADVDPPTEQGRPATATMTVAVADQAALGSLARAPVEVRYDAERRENVLTVPVSALLALGEGGYGLELVTPSGPRVVAVQVGMFANGRVEVSGAGVTEGATVGVPS